VTFAFLSTNSLFKTPPMSTLNDSPLSITASIAGILTFIYAISAGVLGYAYILRSYTNTDTDIQRFYEAFSACALESDLVRQDILASHSPSNPSRPGGKSKYLLDPNSLARLYEQVRAVEIDLQKQAANIIETGPQGEEGWLGQVLGRGRWLTRSKELEASLGKREALTARLLVVQLSLVSAYVWFSLSSLLMGRQASMANVELGKCIRRRR